MTEQLILVIDDDEHSREILRATLSPLNHHVELASDGQTGIDKALELEPDLIFLDVMMPGMTGVEVCQNLRANPRTAQIPIVLVTALSDRATRLQGIEAGADEYITKPIDTLEVRLRAKTILSLNRYRTVSIERARHANILTGVLKVLNELLTIKHAKVFSYSNDMRSLARQLGTHFQVQDLQTLELSTLLYGIGRLTLPDQTLERIDSNVELTRAEQQIVEQLPVSSYQLLARIPGLENIAEIIRWQDKNFDGTGHPRDLPESGEIPLSARILRVVRDFYQQHTYGAEPEMAFRRLKAHSSHYDPEILQELGNLVKTPTLTTEFENKLVKVSELTAKMIPREDIVTVEHSRVLVRAGVSLNRSVIARIRNVGQVDGVKQPIPVTVPVSTTEKP